MWSVFEKLIVSHLVKRPPRFVEREGSIITFTRNWNWAVLWALSAWFWWFSDWFNLPPWRWRRYVPPKHRSFSEQKLGLPPDFPRCLLDFIFDHENARLCANYSPFQPRRPYCSQSPQCEPQIEPSVLLQHALVESITHALRISEKYHAGIFWRNNQLSTQSVVSEAMHRFHYQLIQ
jgi:hypothetical protein